MSSIGTCRNSSILQGTTDLIIKRGRTGCTYGGVSNPIAISAIQKYIRRDMVDKATWIAAGIDLLGLVHDPAFLTEYIAARPTAVAKTVKSQAKALRTNMYHRLIMIVSEDICLANLEAPAVVDKLLQKWVKTRDQPFPNGAHKELLQSVAYLCNSKHVRFGSVLKTFFDLPPYYHRYEENKSGVNTALYHKAHAYLVSKYPDKFLPDTYRKADGASAEELFSQFETELLASSDHRSWYWLGKYFRAAGYKAHGPIVDLIKKHKSKCRPEIVASINVLLKWYHYRHGKTREAITFLYHCLILLMYRNDPRLTLSGLAVPDIDADKIYKDLIGGKRYDIDDYVVDRHTGAKGTSGSLEYFARNGAFVTNKSVFYDKDNEDIYIEMKVLLDSGKVPPVHSTSKVPAISKVVVKPRAEPVVAKPRIKPAVKPAVNPAVKPAVNPTVKIVVAKPAQKSSDHTDPEATIREKYMAQQRTSPKKKYTYMSKELVVKGPYAESEKSFKLHTGFYQMFLKIEEILGLPEKMRTVIPTEIYHNKDGNWLVMPNAGHFDPEQFQEVDTKLDGLIKVIKPDGKGARGNTKLHRILSKVASASLTPDIKRAALQHMYIRMVLGIGDSGLHNMILPHHRAGDRVVIGLDFEEERELSKFKESLTQPYPYAPKLHILFQKKKIAKSNVLMSYAAQLSRIVLLTEDQGRTVGLSDNAMERLVLLNKVIA